jgi:hypothetical protein
MKVVSFQIVIEFELDEQIILSLGPQLKELQEILNGRLTILNTPPFAPPPLPRALIKGADTLLTISLDRFEIRTTPLQHIMHNYESCVKFVKSRIESIFKILRIEDLKYKSLGAISNIQYPSDKHDIPVIKALEPIFDRLINIPRNERDLASFGFLFGFMENDLFINYNISGYELRNIQIIATPQHEQKIITIDATKYPVMESGIEVKIDINNKRRKDNKAPIEDVNLILDESVNKHHSLGKELNLEDFLK